MARSRGLVAVVAAAVLLLACSSDPDTVETSNVAPDADVSSDPADIADAFDFPTSPSGLPEGPSALRGLPDAATLPPPLIPTERLRAGGPPPDGIPPIDEPNYTPAGEVDFLADVEPVLVVAVDDDTRIFPIQIMTWHEIVNDTIGGVPVTVSYCPLCNSAITYDRRIDVTAYDPEASAPAVLDFGTSGMLFNSALVMYDRQTESLWSHFSGQAVAGVLTGVELARFPTTTVGWAQARADHPDAPVLNRDTGHSRSYGQNPYGGYDDVNSSPFLFDGEADGRLAAKERVIGIDERLPDGTIDAVAVRTESLALHDVVEVELAGRELTVWRAPGNASALDTRDIEEGRDVGATAVFERAVDGQTLTFSPTGDDRFVDAETSTTWSVLGRGLDGPLAGEQLAAVEHVDTFWFAWAAFVPDTAVVPAP